MGTNFYKVIKPKINKSQVKEITKNVKQIIKASDENCFITDEQLDYINEQLSELKFTKVHLGKRSCGWQFLWNHNNCEYYEKTLESIKTFLNKNDGWIEDEYGDKYTVDQFIKEEIGEAMYNDPEKYINGPQYDKGKNICDWIKSSNYEFTTPEGLRFSTSTEFC